MSKGIISFSILQIRHMKGLTFITTCLLLASGLNAQDLSFRQYSTKDGIPSAQVYHMFQDELGYVWFATDRGIAKYDGDKFIQYDQFNGLPSSTVFRFYPQKNGKVWCSTFENEWFFFNSKKSDFTHYQYNKLVANYSFGGLNEDMVIDEDGTMHIGYQNLPGVLSVSSDGKVLRKTNVVSDEDRTSVILVSEMQKEEQLHYFLYGDSLPPGYSRVLKNSSLSYTLLDPEEGLYSKVLNVNNHTVYSMHAQLIIQNVDKGDKVMQMESQIIGMGEYDEDLFWIGLRKGGVRVFDLNGEQKYHFLSGESVTHAFHDEHGGFWVSTLSNGVFYAKNKTTRQHNLVGHIAYIHNGEGGQVLAGTFDGGIYECDSAGKELFLDLDLGVPTLAVLNKTINGYAYLSDGKLVLPDRAVSCISWSGSISENEGKSILLGGYKSISWWDESVESIRTLNVQKRTRSLDWAPNGVWIGTLDGLYFCDTLEGKLSSVKQEMLQGRIESIRSKGDTTFFGTMGNGLVVQMSDSIFRISKTEGLSSNLVHELHVENDSTIWVATNNGLNRVLLSIRGVEVRIFNDRDGLQDNYISDVFVKNDHVWIGTRSGLFYMSKTPLYETVDAIDLRLSVHSVVCNGDTLLSSNFSELRYDQNDLLINFNTVYFGGKEEVLYRYKLVNTDDQWTETDRSLISYKSLAPGSYRLSIQAKTARGNWNENKVVLDFRILPPFYKSTWFIVLSIAIIVLVIYAFFKIRVLTYNRDIVRELMRMLLNRITPKSKQFFIRVQGATVKVNSLDVGFVKASGNYLEIHTTKNRYVTRMKIGDFEQLPPDKLDYIRVNRSYIVRIDKITAKSPKSLKVLGQEVPIGRTYQKAISELPF